MHAFATHAIIESLPGTFVQVLPDERASVIVVPKWTADMQGDDTGLRRLVDAFLEIIPYGNMDLQTFKDQIEQDIADEEATVTNNNDEARTDKAHTVVKEAADTVPQSGQSDVLCPGAQHITYRC